MRSSILHIFRNTWYSDESASGVASKNLIDAVTGYDSSSIGMAATVIIGMSIGNIIVNAITSRISTKINVKVGNEIRADIYDRIIKTDRE